MSATALPAPDGSVNQDAMDFVRDFLEGVKGPLWVCSLLNPVEGSSRVGEDDDEERGKKRTHRHILTRDLSRIASFIRTKDEPGYGMYFCVSSMTPGNRRRKEFAQEMPFIPIDIDFKHIAISPDEILSRLLALPHPPHRVHRSGGGYHVFWRLEEAVGRDLHERAESLMKALVRILGGDPMPTHTAALLRVVGSHNTKGGGWREVVVEHNVDGTIAFDDLEAWALGCTDVVIERKGVGNTDDNPFSRQSIRQGSQAPIDVEARLAAMRVGGGDIYGVHPSLLSITASLTSSGVDEDKIIKKLIARLKQLDGTESWNWAAETVKIRGMCRSAWVKFDRKRRETPSTDDVSLRDAVKKPYQTEDTAKADTEDGGGVTLDDFRAYMPAHNYIFTPTREPWPAGSVNARLGKIPLTDANGTPILDDDGEQKLINASTWLDQNASVEQMVWVPGRPMLIEDQLVSEGGFIDRMGVTILNLYRPPTIKPGDGREALGWLEHVRKVYPDNADHIVKWLAHRVQRPGEKINHALVLGGDQGIGKDSLLEPVKQAIGPWNFIETSPQQILGRFNGFIKSVILRVSEARDLGDVNRFAFYEHMKTLTAAPPDVLRCDEKNLREHNVINVTGVIMTTNRKDSLYLPSDDRRHYVAWSSLTKDDFTADYWNDLWHWYSDGGSAHVAAYLTELDLSDFNAKAPPEKTSVFWQIVDSNRTPENSELAHVLERMGSPNAVTLARIAEEARAQDVSSDNDFYSWFTDRKNRRMIPHRLEECGYVSLRNETRADGLWRVGSAPQAIYVRLELSFREQHAAAAELVRGAA